GLLLVSGLGDQPLIAEHLMRQRALLCGVPQQVERRAGRLEPGAGDRRLGRTLAEFERPLLLRLFDRRRGLGVFLVEVGEACRLLVPPLPGRGALGFVLAAEAGEDAVRSAADPAVRVPPEAQPAEAAAAPAAFADAEIVSHGLFVLRMNVAADRGD